MKNAQSMEQKVSFAHPMNWIRGIFIERVFTMDRQRGFTPLEVRTKDGHPALLGLSLTGFTLIELLVVIAIIALLMSILMPAVASVKKQTKNMLCLARLREWGLIFSIYSEENDNQPVPGVHYTDNERLMELSEFEEMRYCPLAIKKFSEGARHPFAVSEIADTSYGLNLWVGKVGGSRPRERCWLTTLVKRAWNIPLFTDSTYADECDPTPRHWDEPPEYDGELPLGDINEMQRVCMNRHNGGVNCTFLDFSARKVGLKELWELEWSRNWFTDSVGKPDYDPPEWPEWMRDFKDYR